MSEIIKYLRMQLCELIIHTHYRSFNKFFLHKLTSNETLEMATNILDESKSTSINDLQVRMSLQVLARIMLESIALACATGHLFLRATNFTKKGKLKHFFVEIIFVD